MSAELQLSTRILVVLNPSIMSIITRGPSCGCYTLLASFSKNRMSLSVFLYFRGGILWMLLTCRCIDFLRDMNDPPVDGPPVIVFISPIAHWDNKTCGARPSRQLHACHCYHSWICWSPTSSQISTTSLSE